ncbi:hypothetical protein BT63DRAFT_425534 [Microthyrium microscopicum]|uniref:A to I editase domain-containing protein n=1 Tax=Microthyrium microscopicum TaxID=703497 RepID=A0A6A6U7H2_9PEZI|nr:hypothetical protein BT63DRAFT_425534 [Microthyrium microscopicum]
MAADSIALAVTEAFARLPKRYKPGLRSNGVHEWIPLAGIVLEKEGLPLYCISACTGSKCQAQDRIQISNGNIIHDSHAEVLAIRAFNYWLIHQCADLARSLENSSLYLKRRENSHVTKFSPQPFTIRADVKIHLYCSESPCGDASLELSLERQEDSTPWGEGPERGPENLLGHSHFGEVGVVRRKPGRSDSPNCLSKSCTDKLAMHQCTSLINAAAAPLIHPENAYLHTVVLPTSSKLDSCTRAFSQQGRMSPIAESSKLNWPLSFAFKPFRIVLTTLDFEFSRADPKVKYTACNRTAIYSPLFQEAIINGMVQGYKAGNIRFFASLDDSATVVSRV